MREIHRIISWRAWRSWIGEHVGLLLVVVVAVYLVGFFWYHAFVPVDALVWQAAARYTVGESCELLIEYPTKVPLTSPEEAGYPLTIRMSHTPGVPANASAAVTGCAPDVKAASYTVQLGPVGEGLEFTDAEGATIPATVPVTVGSTESAVTPARIYVRRASAASVGPVALVVRVEAVDGKGIGTFLSTSLKGQPEPVIQPESEGASRWKRLLEVLFNAGPLQWMFTAVAGLIGVWEIYTRLQRQQDEKREKATERVKVQRERIDALRDITPSDRAFRTYMSLWTEYKANPDALRDLRNAFQPEWLHHLRQQLGRCVRARQFDEAERQIDDLAWEWHQAANEKTYLAIKPLLQQLRKPTHSSSQQPLTDVLEGFRAVGLETAEPVTDWLEQAHPDQEATRHVLFRHGGAGGRYLLERWGERDDQVNQWLREWELESRPANHDRVRIADLWAKGRGESLIVQRGVQRLGLDFNPFGPEKAEQDPRLPDLFYRLSPVWEEVTAPQPSIVIAPPTSGRSALMWMIRYESGLIGSCVETVFPVFVPLFSCASPQELGETLRTAIGAALCRALACDPYGLLGLGDIEQRGLSELLLNSAGGLSSLLRQLQAAGLSSDDPDGQLLRETLTAAARTRETWGGEMNWDTPRFHPFGMKHTFLLVDVACADRNVIDMLLESLFERWLPSLAPRHVVPKVFVPVEPDDCPITPVPIVWDECALNGLLRHRMERAGLMIPAGRPALEGWVEDVQEPDRVLIQGAKGSPARLVRLGNKLIRRINQSEPLGAGEFLDITTALWRRPAQGTRNAR
jgi:hypothetical protein